MSVGTEFRRQLIDDYQGALIRVATLRASKQQYLVFGWVELYPFDMRIPDKWTAGDEPWRVPKSDGWTCAFSASPVRVSTALDWYESASHGDLAIEVANGRKIKIQTTQFGPEPAYGSFCAGVDAPFALCWHDGPRIHRYVPLLGSPEPVRQLGSNSAARDWLNLHLGFNPYDCEEWLGGLALLAPDPICAAVHPCFTARADDGRETLTVQVVPRRSVERGIADMSGLSVHVAERRFGSWQSVKTIPLGPDVSAIKFENQQRYGEVGYALVCASRGLLRFVEPQSGIEQIGIGMLASDSTLKIEVPAEGHKKPAKTVAVTRFRRSQISVGAALNDAVRTRIIAAQERRRKRQERAQAPQRILGSHRVVRNGLDLQQKRQEAEDFVAGLVGGAQRRVVFVDPFFDLRQTRLFALRGSGTDVRVRILTGQPGLKLWHESGRSPRSLLAADLAYLRSVAKEKLVVVPTVRIMQGGDTPAIHDRYIVIDAEVWHCGPSFNELGVRVGVIVRLPDPIPVRREINAVWSQSTPLEQL